MVTLSQAGTNRDWNRTADAGWALGITGAAGVLYAMMTIRHARRTRYKPDAADWTWYAGLPLLAYIVLLGSAVLLAAFPIASQFLIAGTAILLLFVGIHNAWDTVTYVAVEHWKRKDES